MAANGYKDYTLTGFYKEIMRTVPMLYNYQFILEFAPRDVGSELFNDPSNPENNFTYYAQSARLPQINIVKGRASYFGTEFRVPGTIQYQHDYSVKILLEQNMNMYEKLRIWMRRLSDLRLDGGGNRLIPNVALYLNLLKSDHKEISTRYVLEGVWPTRISDIGLKYAQNDTTPLTVTCDFKYQYCYRDDDFQGTNDPMRA